MQCALYRGEKGLDNRHTIWREKRQQIVLTSSTFVLFYSVSCVSSQVNHRLHIQLYIRVYAHLVLCIFMHSPFMSLQSKIKQLSVWCTFLIFSLCTVCIRMLNFHNLALCFYQLAVGSWNGKIVVHVLERSYRFPLQTTIVRNYSNLHKPCSAPFTVGKRDQTIDIPFGGKKGSRQY